LFALAAGGAATLIAACRAGQARSSPTAGYSSEAAKAAITIPKSSVALPTGPVTFRWIDSGDLKALFYRPFFEAYHAAHPNITIQYDALPWDDINRLVPLGVQNGNAHDVFAKPQKLSAGEMVQQGWVTPLDDVVPNFGEWKQRFPYGAFIPGIHVFDGKTYTFPVTSNKRYGTVLFYNVEQLQRAGYDPEAKPLTWDEFRKAAKKLTEQGNGQSYGVVVGGGGSDGGQWGGIVSNLARMAGAAASTDDIDWKTGHYSFTGDAYLAAIELLLALQADGSLFPGSASLAAPQARAQFPQGIAGMILDGPWVIPQWPQINPAFKFGVASQPVPNSGAPLPLTYEETGANQEWVYAKSPNTAIAGDMFDYIASEDGQYAVMIASQGNLRAIFPKAVARAEQSQQLDPQAGKALALFERQIKLGPMPEVRNPDVAKVQLELRHVTPDRNETLQGIMTGQLRDAKQAMHDLEDRMNAELDRAINAAQQKGAQVSRQDWVFPNWDPTKDYTEADYKTVGGS
jgi:multiple sugar transport system substrate-binding protein